ncbi:MAG TPA: PfkB family carbohydrate kinase [Chthoniobacterales bacterium]|jgi:sugar/nucleoside kinase (ribokinase family)
MSVLVVGSIGIDSIRTQLEERRDVLGGAASYASIAASFFVPVKLVGIVGSDFPQEYIELLKSRGISLEGVQIAEGNTFRWSGEYDWDMNKRKTLSIALNVFENFTPKLPDTYKRTPIILLGNISPVLQNHVLDQVEDPRLVIADTMDLWITTTRPDLLKLLKRVDLLVLNDSEARQLTEETSLIKAGRNILRLGPRFVAIKKGEHGCLLLSRDHFFSCGAFPLEDIHDPTGAGDTFAGGFAGYLASLEKEAFEFADLKKAVVYGSLLASFCVESFSVDRIKTLSRKEIEERYELFRLMSHFEVIE